MSFLRNKKLLFVSNDLDFFLSHRLPLAIEAEKEGYIVYVASDKIPKKKIGNIYFKKYSIYRSSTSITKNLKSLMELKAIIKEISPDIIHSITLIRFFRGFIFCFFFF